MSSYMKKSKTLFEMILELWGRLNKKRRYQFLFILILMISAAICEMFTVGAIVPFLGILTASNNVSHNEYIQIFIAYLPGFAAQNLTLFIAIFFILLLFVSGAVRLLLLYVSTKFSYAVGADLSLEVYRRTLYQPYETHIARNSAEVINGITGKTAMMIGSILVPLLNFISSVILLTGVLLAFFMISPLIALSSGFAIGCVYLVVLAFNKKRLKANSECIARESNNVIKALQEGLGGIRDVLLEGAQEEYCRSYQGSDYQLRMAYARNAFISASPRYFVETCAMIFIVGLAYFVSQVNGLGADTIPMLGAFALGAQKILPTMQQGYSALTIIRGAESSLRDVHAFLDQPLPNSSELKQAILFQDSIELKDVSFKYSGAAQYVLKDINLIFKKGMKIGFVGATGSGKSTLLDVLMALLNPTVGQLLVDGQLIDQSNAKMWQARIAHVPQHIYLSDASIAENIAFGVSYKNIDFERVRLAASKAQISSVIDGMSDGYLSARVMIFGSHTECQPLVLIDAMSTGLPFVARRTGSIPSMLGGVTATSQKEASELLTEIYNNQSIWLKYNSRGIKMIEDVHHPKIVSEALIKLI